ncbi:Hillarin-like 2 [Homarus americanus]|uniref:Hillarin-like 2 n=1 Tax=Homarus americanus TaxID=6706 RepID=A0A8J5N7T5_HOMAM|nr:Hillarin-like 2 [Homarus americanus]
MVDVSVQTDNDILTDEAPEFAARPPQCKKSELLSSVNFTTIDAHALTIPREGTKDTAELVRYLCKPAADDLQRLRALFQWVTGNIRFDWKYMEIKQTVGEVLWSRAGVSKDYVALLVEMCHLAGLRVKKIHGFARGRDFRVGRVFEPERDPLHSWLAVFLYGSWRFLDPTLGSGHVDKQGKFHPHLQEHFFLTDPDYMIHSHFPYDNLEHNYNRWQLLDSPLSLEDFNSLPNVMPEFWSCGLKLCRPKHNPVVFRNQTEITVIAPTLIRYKYKFFPATETEESCINQWVFCTLKEGGAIGSFTILPPVNADYILKIYAGNEELLDDEGSALDHVVSFLLICEKARRYPVPWPTHDVAWGPTPRLYECGLDPVNQIGPVIVTWGGKKLIYFEKACDVMVMFQVFDTEGHMLDLKGIVGREETEEHLRLVIIPPGIGYYKFLIYGIPRPQVGGSVVQGRWRLPLLAAYLIECKMSLGNPKQELETHTNTNKTKNKRKIKVVPRR